MLGFNQRRILIFASSLRLAMVKARRRVLCSLLETLRVIFCVVAMHKVTEIVQKLLSQIRKFNFNIYLLFNLA